MFDLYEPLSEKVKLPAAQYRPRKSPNVSFITDFFLRLDNNTSFDKGIFCSTTAHKEFISNAERVCVCAVYPWGPDQAAPDIVVLKNRQAYYAAVSYVDEQVGKLMDALAAMTLRNNTIVIVHGDHGFQLGGAFHYSRFPVLLHMRKMLRIPAVGRFVVD